MDTGKLISSVFVRRPLWDKSDKNHHNRFVLDRLWNEVGQELNTTRNVPRNKWKALRDNFRKILLSIPAHRYGDAAATEHITWPYFQSLLFLKDQFTPRDTSRNSELLELEEISDDQSSITTTHPENLDFLENNSFNSHVLTPELDQPPRKKAKTVDMCQTLLHIEREKMEFLQRRNDERLNDEDLHFFQSLLPSVRTLNQIDKLSFRIDIMKTLQQYLLKAGPTEGSGPSKQEI